MADWVKKHGIFTRLAVVWVLVLVTFVIYQVMQIEHWISLGMANATFLGALFGLPPLVFGLLSKFNGHGP